MDYLLPVALTKAAYGRRVDSGSQSESTAHYGGEGMAAGHGAATVREQRWVLVLGSLSPARHPWGGTAHLPDSSSHLS